MKVKYYISFIILVFAFPFLVFAQHTKKQFDFYGSTIEFSLTESSLVSYSGPLSEQSIHSFYKQLSSADYTSIVNAITFYKGQQKPDDWLFYQLIRKTAQQISPKSENYFSYTLYKWFFLTKAGYDAQLIISKDKMLFYVRSDENIYNIPTRVKDGKQYVCLNFHDYQDIDFEKDTFTEVSLPIPETTKLFSYKLTNVPSFSPDEYLEKDLLFTYNENEYHFKVKINPQVKTIFANYPVVDYESYFGVPLSNETYQSLIPKLKDAVKGLSKKNGVDYLMRFTRNAFHFKPDTENFGKEKRLLPEQTLLYEGSDCEDRAALFFCLVKEIYDLPMIVLAFPKHVTIAVKFDKPIGHSIVYDGDKYSICEPTPQKEDLNIGQLPSELYKTAYEVVYVHTPNSKIY